MHAPQNRIKVEISWGAIHAAVFIDWILHIFTGSCTSTVLLCFCILQIAFLLPSVSSCKEGDGPQAKFFSQNQARLMNKWGKM